MVDTSSLQIQILAFLLHPLLVNKDMPIIMPAVIDDSFCLLKGVM